MQASNGSRELADGLRFWASAVGDLSETLIAEDAEEALEQLTLVPQIAALVVDLAATAGGVVALERIREQHPLLPILVLVGATASRARVHQLKCEWCTLPANVRELRHFVLRAQGFQRVQNAWRSWLVEYGAKTYGLSSRATGLLTQAVREAAPGLLMAELGVTHHTLLAQVSRLLTPRGEVTELARADDLLARLLANTSLREWDRQRPDELAPGVAGEPELHH
jgi:CheY-like chemotaxis protein